MNPLGGKNELPPGYTRLEYLESQPSGNQYINLDYVPDGDSGLYCRYLHLSSNSSSIFVMGLSQTTSTPPTGMICVPSMGYSATTYAWGGPFSVGRPLGIPSVYPAEGWLNYYGSRQALLRCNGEEWMASLGSFDYVVTRPLYLGMLNRGGANSYSFHGRIYEARITQGKKLVCHCVPALDADATPCMYDVIRKLALYNSGSGQYVLI